MEKSLDDDDDDVFDLRLLFILFFFIDENRNNTWNWPSNLVLFVIFLQIIDIFTYYLVDIPLVSNIVCPLWLSYHVIITII